MKLIKHKEGYSLCIEENGSNSREFIATTDGMYVKHRLSKQNCDEIFGVIDVDNLVDKFVEGLDISEKVKHDIQFGYQEGLIKSMELNKDKLFTVEDIKKAIEYGIQSVLQAVPGVTSTESILDRYNYQQSKEIEVEIVTHVDLAATPTDSRHPDAYLGTDTGIPFLDENGCLILKKK
jgi:hypothetical protein